MVGGSTRIPKIQQIVKDFFEGKILHTRLHADEAVAYGATIQAGILSGETTDQTQDLLLIDIAPLTLGTNKVREENGIIVERDVMSVIIPRNTAIPFEKTKRYSTVKDNQTSFRFKILQGEFPTASSNH